MSQSKIRLHLFMANFAIIILIAMVSFVPRSQARVVAEEFLEKGKKIVVLQNIRDDDGVVEGMAISGPNGLEVRVDSDGDGEVDWRKIESGDYEIEQSWPANGIFHRMKVVRKLPKERLEALFFLARDRKGYELWKIEKRPYEVMYLLGRNQKTADPSHVRAIQTASKVAQPPVTREPSSVTQPRVGEDVFCSLRAIKNPTDSSWLKLANTLERKSILESPSAKSLVHGSCAEHEKVILEGMAELLIPQREGTPRYLSCLANLEGYKEQANSIMFRYWSFIYSSGSSSAFQCPSDFDSGPLARFTEQSPTADKKSPPIALNKMLLDLQDPRAVAGALFHELVHTQNNLDEDKVRMIDQCCLPSQSGSRPESCKMKNNSRSGIGEGIGKRRIRMRPDLMTLVELAESRSAGNGNEVIQDIDRIIENRIRPIVCLRSNPQPPSCKMEIQLALEKSYSEILEKYCSNSDDSKCKNIKSNLMGGISREIEECVAPQLNYDSLCAIERPTERTTYMGKKRVDLANRVRAQTSGDRAERIQPNQSSGVESVPPMTFSPIRGDDVQVMRVAARESQSVLPRVISRMKESVGRIDTSIVPRAEAQVHGSTSTFKAPKYGEMKDSESPIVTLANGTKLTMLQPFSLNEGSSRSGRTRTIASSGGGLSSFHESHIGQHDSNSEDIGVALKGDTSKVGNIDKGVHGFRRSGQSAPSTASSGEMRSSSLNSIPASSKRTQTSDFAVKTEKEALLSLKDANDPEGLASQPLFEKSLELLDIQILGGLRPYGSKASNPKTKWNLKMFGKRGGEA